MNLLLATITNDKQYSAVFLVTLRCCVLQLIMRCNPLYPLFYPDTEFRATQRTIVSRTSLRLRCDDCLKLAVANWLCK